MLSLPGAVAAHLTTWQMQVQCAGNFEKKQKKWKIFNRTLLSWISNFRIIMDFTGVRKSVKRPKYRSFSYPLQDDNIEYCDGNEHGRRRFYRKTI